MASGPLLFGLLVVGTVVLGFVGVWRLATIQDPVDARLKQYGGDQATADQPQAQAGPRPRWAGFNRALRRQRPGERLASQLARADVQLTVAEFVLIQAASAAVFGFLGWLRGSVPLALVLAVLGLLAPYLYLSFRAGRRRQAFTNQLPDVLTLLVGALRAGYGITQAIDMLVARMSKPASVEFARVMRAVSLGLPVNRALNDMADRVGSDDLYLVVTAMNVQQELGGNLAQILETITDTVRERIRVKREIRVFTSQQRLTGMILAALPLVVGALISVANPVYFSGLLQPGLMRVVIIAAAVMQVLGFLVIRKIVNIEV